MTANKEEKAASRTSCSGIRVSVAGWLVEVGAFILVGYDIRTITAKFLVSSNFYHIYKQN